MGNKNKGSPKEEEIIEEVVEIDFTPPWPRISMIAGLEEKTG